VNNKIEIFSDYAYKFKVPDYKTLNENLISEIYTLKEENEQGLFRSNYGGWHSKEFNRIIKNNEVDAGLKMKMKTSGTGWYSEYGNKNFKDLTKIISNFFSKEILNIDGIIEPCTLWALVNGKDDYNEGHTHGRDTYYSGVYYVKIPKNSGNLYFMDMHWDPHLMVSYPDIYKSDKSIKEVEIKSEEGDLYLFKGKVPHRVGKNFSNEDRISISFNFKYRDIVEQCKGKDIKWD